MKLIFTLLTTVLLSFSVYAQNGLYVKYQLDLTATSDEADMMAMMMNGSTMELAFSKSRTFAKTQMGSMMTMSIQYEVEQDDMLMLMSGMMGNMAFQGKLKEMEEKEEEADQKNDGDIQLINETRKIMGYKCKKAILTDAEGNKATYWYAEKITPPNGLDQMPNQVPGLCLEMSLPNKNGLLMTYKAITVKEDVDIDEYIVKIPEGVEVQSLKDLKNMGGGF